MLAAIHVNNSAHQQQYGALMEQGLRAHGVRVVRGAFGRPERCDFAVIWGYRQHVVIQSAPHVLIMERGHVGDRQAQTSLGWDGLGGKGRYPEPPSGDTTGQRWRWSFGDLLCPWRHDGRYVLVCGQVPGDEAVKDINISNWVIETCATIRRDWDLPVLYRPHPLVVDRGHVEAMHMPGVEVSTNYQLSDDLADAMMAVTYSSTSGVEIALAGVPLVTLSRGSMAWDVAAHNLDSGPFRPDRTEWAHRLAYTQWSAEEISSGIAWDLVRTRLNG